MHWFEKTRVRSLKYHCARASTKSRTQIGSDQIEATCDYDHSEAKRNVLTIATQLGKDAGAVDTTLQQLDCSIDMSGLLDDSSLFHVALEIQSLCRPCARRSEALHGVVSTRSRSKIAGCMSRIRIVDFSHRGGRYSSLVRIQFTRNACGGSPPHPVVWEFNLSEHVQENVPTCGQNGRKTLFSRHRCQKAMKLNSAPCVFLKDVISDLFANM